MRRRYNVAHTLLHLHLNQPDAFVGIGGAVVNPRKNVTMKVCVKKIHISKSFAKAAHRLPCYREGGCAAYLFDSMAIIAALYWSSLSGSTSSTTVGTDSTAGFTTLSQSYSSSVSSTGSVVSLSAFFLECFFLLSP